MKVCTISHTCAQNPVTDRSAVDPPDVSGLSDDELQEQLIQAQKEAAEARAEYLLRSKITQSVLVTDPILKAVHGGPTTGYAEKSV
jgi:hypothetical protein